MSKALIIVNAEVRSGNVSANAPVAAKMVTAMVKAIQNSNKPVQPEIIGAADLWSKSVILSPHNDDLIYCPLTIQLPNWVEFPAKKIFELCRELKTRRNWVEQHFQYKTSSKNSWLGDLWLPVVLTAKGILYGEVIGEGEIPNSYQQPINFKEHIRQSLYKLAAQLLESINATPAVYLLQFRILGEVIVFDRLWPFPASPAIASIKLQQPDLFACHWHCLTGKPIVDLKIVSP